MQKKLICHRIVKIPRKKYLLVVIGKLLIKYKRNCYKNNYREVIIIMKKQRLLKQLRQENNHNNSRYYSSHQSNNRFNNNSIQLSNKNQYLGNLSIMFSKHSNQLLGRLMSQLIIILQVLRIVLILLLIQVRFIFKKKQYFQLQCLPKINMKTLKISAMKLA